MFLAFLGLIVIVVANFAILYVIGWLIYDLFIKR